MSTCQLNSTSHSCIYIHKSDVTLPVSTHSHEHVDSKLPLVGRTIIKCLINNEILLGVKRMPFNSNKAADEAAEAGALVIDLMLKRSMSVLTGIETESAFMDNLRGRKRETVEWQRQTWGILCRTFTGWWEQTSIFPNANKKKLPLAVTRLTSFALHIVLLDCFIAGQKQEDVTDIWRILMWREIQLYPWIILSIVI